MGASASDTPWLPAGRELDLPGRGTTFVRDTGAGANEDGAERSTVLLLHGWTVTADLNFFRAYPVLAERFRVVAFDQRGHGRGIRPANGDVALDDCADDAAAVLDVLGIESAVTVGYSMGGLVAQLLARRHPDRVRGLVLGSTAAAIPTGALGLLWRAPVDPVRWWAARDPERTTEWVRRRVVRRVGDGDEFEDWMRAEYRSGDGAGIISSLRSLSRFSSDGWLGTLRGPAAVIATETDTVVPPPRQHALARRLAATLHRFDGPHDAVVTHHRHYVPLLAEVCATVDTEAALGR